jgi:hypothetical protein
MATPEVQQHAYAFAEAQDALANRYQLEGDSPFAAEAAYHTRGAYRNMEEWRKMLREIETNERSGNPLFFSQQNLRKLAQRRIQDELARMAIPREKQVLREAKRQAVFSALESIRKRPQTRATAGLLQRYQALPTELRRKIVNELSGAPTTFPALPTEQSARATCSQRRGAPGM